MSTTPLLGPAPITVGESIFDPKPGKCFACTPPYKHDRVWIPDTTERTLVLCFDGTGDSFDHDVSRPSSLGPGLQLNAASTEFQCRAILGNVEEGRPC